MTVLVVGSGVIGLRTAVELIRRKTRIRLVSPRHPLHQSTCSMGAGGLWMPFHCDDKRTDQWAFETLDELMTYVGKTNESLVEVVPAISFKQEPKDPPLWATNGRSNVLGFQTLTIDDLYRESLTQNFRLPRRELMDRAGYSHAWLFQTPIVDSPKMLMHLVQELEASDYSEDINFEGKQYNSIQEMIDDAKKYGCNSLVNCTGLGSRVVCSDESLVGARGVLFNFDRASCKWNVKPESRDTVVMIEEPPIGSETAPCYMIPRGDIIAVGGTYLESDEKTEVRSEEKSRIFQHASTMGIDVDRSKPPGQWIGFRPYRPSARLELDTEYSEQGVKVVHSFGYGGSGWTVFVGAAKEAASLLSSS